MLEEISDLYDFALNFQNFCEKTKENGSNKEIFSVKFKILFLIYKHGQLSPTNIVKFLNMAKSNIALFCRQLLKEQLIISKIDELDHRIVYYFLTKKGDRYVQKELENVNSCLVHGFSKKEIADMHNYIKKVNKIFLKTGE